MTHICIIGAGSAVFSLDMVRDICLTPALHGSAVTLMDIDPARLDAIHSLTTRYAQEIGATLELRKTTDRREALRGAEIVVNAALTAGHQRLRDGWKLARQLGYRWGGSLHVMHDEAFWINFYQLRFFDEVMQDILDICPQAWYIQVANPVQAGITYLARAYPGVKMVGLCHGTNGVYKIARHLGLDPAHLQFEVPGVNHFVWLTRMTHRGEDALALLDRWIEDEAHTFWATHERYGELTPKKVDLYKRLGAYPIGDTAGDGGGSWGWWYHADDATEERWREKPGRFWQRFFTGGEQEVAKIRHISSDPAVRITDHFPPETSHENIVPMIESLACGTERTIISNIANRGPLVPGVPEDFQVEVWAKVGKDRIEGIPAQPLPPAVLSYLLRDCVDAVNLELEAYTRCDRKLLFELIMQDPWTRSMDQANALLDSILALPYHAEMRSHYR